MTAAIPRGPGGWVVTGQTETTDLDPATGQYVSGYRISFTTAGGHVGSVFVTSRGYYPEMVRTIIDSKAALIDAVGSLTSDG